MSKVTYTQTVTINELRKMIPVICPDLTMVIQSEPGCGKSSILKMLEEDLGDAYEYIYVDCPVKDMSDIGMTIPNHATRQLEYYASSLFRLDSPKPKVIMLDEMMKAPKLLQVIFTRMMLERTVGDVALPEGSMVFATSNNASDNVGDTMMAHAGNRVCRVEMAKPSAAEWSEWAIKNNISPIVIAFAKMFPRCLETYRTGDQADNPYIFDPKKAAQLSFVSPRSLAKSSVIVSNSAVLGENATQMALRGTVGDAAAADLAAFISLHKSLPSHESIIASPETAMLPHDVAAQIMIVLNAVQHIQTHDDLSAYMTYANRFANVEIQSLFFTQCMRNPKLLALDSHKNKMVAQWAKNNYTIM